MIRTEDRPTRFGLEALDIPANREVYWNLAPPVLVEHALRAGDGRLASSGALVTETGEHTGRSPNDRFIVRDEQTDSAVWWGPVNAPMTPEHFDRLRERIISGMRDTDLYVRDAWCGAGETYRLGVRVISTSAWHSMFAHNMFVRSSSDERKRFDPDWVVLHAPEVTADPSTDGTRSGTFVVLNFGRREVLIGGTRYAGEIKKAIFSVMNFRLTERGVLPMHCSANIGPSDDTALFFGLSGTGKTTLSADPERPLIGDDEHGWGPYGVFNFEGGCYAKAIRITPQSEPEIFRAASRFGTILENVTLDAVTRRPDFDDDALTENTRASYPIHHLENIAVSGTAGHPRNIVFLTADAFGVLPPIARLSRDQAMYHFISGYTAKVAGTERGVKEPSATFSACFGAPFMPRHPVEYARMLGEFMTQHRVNVWLVNTGWTGGPYGQGQRMPLMHTRAMLRAALDGALDDIPTEPHPVFGVQVPERVPNVPDEVLDPRSTWDDPAAYDAKAAELARMFADNFECYADRVDAAIVGAGPYREAIEGSTAD